MSSHAQAPAREISAKLDTKEEVRANFDDQDSPPVFAPKLGRSMSCPSPSLLASGVPAFMARKAAVHVGNDEADQRAFILANADQPDEWWLSQVYREFVSFQVFLIIPSNDFLSNFVGPTRSCSLSLP